MTISTIWPTRGGKSVDMTGVETEWVRVISAAPSDGLGARWRCICKGCGASCVLYGFKIRTGAKGCGCSRRRLARDWPEAPTTLAKRLGVRVSFVVRRARLGWTHTQMVRAIREGCGYCGERATVLDEDGDPTCAKHQVESPAARIDDIGGRSFTRLRAIEGTGRRENGKTFWDCRCECGAVVTVLANNLRGGNTKSCGCLRRRVEAA